eukprot:TRINITY_DN46480_c0_g1_i4.p1 TRINITY_DN46480_c0_g1~~TRINITY_DN46480_c0_g1_i4.p1  ORF type:complete len:134 (-),score=14.56 TRINITY_DN46480_c0_g1_i4:122-523(-)
MLDATTHVYPEADGKASVARISIGPNQDLLFVELPKTETRRDPYDGYHLCIYIANFSKAFKKFKARKLLFINERFADRAESLEQALHDRSFRFKDIIMTSGRGRLFTLEHEVRSTFHPSYLKPLVNKSDMFGY